MMLSGTLKIVTTMLLAIALKPLIVTSVTTSYESLRVLRAKGDLLMIETIQKQIKEELEFVSNLSIILTQVSQLRVPHVSLPAEHPNDLYLLVKHHVHTWYSALLDSSLFSSEKAEAKTHLERVIDGGNVNFPKEGEVEAAARALLRLQSVYRLRARDMFSGDYLGHRGAPLTTGDAYRLGRQAFDAGDLPQSIEWLQMVADMQTKARGKQAEQKAPADTLQTPSEDVLSDHKRVETLALLGRAFAYTNDWTKAQDLFLQCLEYGGPHVPEVEALREDLQNWDRLQRTPRTPATDTDQNVTALCSRGKQHRVSAIRPDHMCRYKENVYIPYQRFPEEILSTSPYVSVLYDVIYDAEIERLKSIAREEWKLPLEVKNKSAHGTESGQRSYEELSVSVDNDPLVTRVSQRVLALTGLELKQNGTIQVVNFGIGGLVDPRLNASTKRAGNGYRDTMAIVQFYLSDVEKGAASIFPQMGISVSPVKGSALLWFKYPPHVKHEHKNSLHVECPVLIGNKWIAQVKTWIEDNAFRRPCGPTVESTQLDVENIVSVDALKQKTY